MTSDDSFSALRAKIDQIDEQIVGLIGDRAKIATAIGKAKGGAPVYRAGREAQVLDHVTRLHDGPLPDGAIQAIYREIIASCRNLESATTVAYLGPAGTYSQAAARLQFGQSSKLVPCDSLTEVFSAAEKGTTQLAVVPIENSIEGTVNLTLDLLRQSSLCVAGELLLPIHHQLLAKSGTLTEIKEVVAHPQALAQCAGWLGRNLPRALRHEVTSNGEGARIAAKTHGVAAIAGTSAIDTYELIVLATNIEDQSSNTTRFLVLGTGTPSPTGRDKTSLICITPNQPGALYGLLDCLAHHKVNMTKLEARPSRENNWDYVFYIDIEGHQQDGATRDALRDLRQKATFVKVLGSYPLALEA